MCSPDHPKLSRNAIPIIDPEVLDFLKKIDRNNFLFNALQDVDIKDRFLNEYFKWIQTSKLNHIKGIKIFKHLAYVHGTSQTFDFFYAENKNCRFRCFRGEFFYHALSWRNNYRFKYLEDESLEKNDAVVMSIPFSGNGYLHENTQQVIEKCNKLDIPVMIDMAYYNLVRDLDVSLDDLCDSGDSGYIDSSSVARS